MRLLSALVLFSALAFASENASLAGDWEGEPKCTVPNSPCHDEQALYRLSPGDKEGNLSIDAYKIIEGVHQFMGTIACEYHRSQSTLTCTGHTPKQDLWEFQVAGDTITGTLKIGPEKTLYRRVTLHRARKKES